MSSDVTTEQLDMVRQWANQGVDLNGIQKRLSAECGVHLTYMEVRFLLLDNGIEIARAEAVASAASEHAAETSTPPTEAEKVEEGGEVLDDARVGKPVVTLDELQLPGALVSGKVVFSSGTKGAWIIDQTGRFGWNDLDGTPTPAELQAFQFELTQLLRRA